MVSPLHQPMAPWVYAADAEGQSSKDYGGYGVVATRAGAQEAELAWLAGVKAHHTLARLDGSISHLVSGERALMSKTAVSRVPRSLLQLEAHAWQPVAWGRWTFADPIMLGEGRALVALMERVAGHPGAHHFDAVVLEDNESLAGAVAKGRSPCRAVNYLLRKLAALSCASGIRPACPWVDTKHQPADALSRL